VADPARDDVRNWRWDRARAVGIASAGKWTILVYVVREEDKFFILRGIVELVLRCAAEEVGRVH
jgi:hypothetical protein